MCTPSFVIKNYNVDSTVEIHYGAVRTLADLYVGVELETVKHLILAPCQPVGIVSDTCQQENQIQSRGNDRSLLGRIRLLYPEGDGLFVGGYALNSLSVLFK